VADLVSYLSGIVALYPGDLIFTGTPGGVGAGRSPQEFLQAGDQLISKIETLGALTINLE
jgi:2-keto-4-pentenoate hydratase/2-oxohepta-3-ene-1,7-dioic acid hydratase (catechol pathway)